MKKLLQNQRFITTVIVIMAFAAGLVTSSFWVNSPNGMAVDAGTLRPGNYLISYSYSGPIAPMKIATYKKDGTHMGWKVILAVNAFGTDSLFVAIDSNDVKWKEHTDQRELPYLEVLYENGRKKKFVIYWQPSTF